MIRLDRRDRVLVNGYAAMAGIVDAIGFLSSGGFFFSFMSGNSTRLSVGLAQGAPYIITVGALLVSFVVGVISGSLIGRNRLVLAHRRQALILSMIAVLLFLSPILAHFGFQRMAWCMAAFCMGAENTLYEREGSVSFGLTYMTGALVKIGQGLATMFMGGGSLLWLPYLLLWIGLILGAASGALLFQHFGFYGLWLASAMAMVFAVINFTAPVSRPPYQSD